MNQLYSRLHAIRRSRNGESGSGGRHKAALARLHSARSLNRSQGFTAGCRGSSLAPTGRRSFHELLSAQLPALDCMKDRKSEKEDDILCQWNGGFWGGTQGEDGFIEWAGEAAFQTFRDGKPAGWRRFPSDKMCLEVGTTAAVKTMAQLRTNGAIARWPYGHKEITLLKLVSEKALMPRFPGA